MNMKSTVYLIETNSNSIQDRNSTLLKLIDKTDCFSAYQKNEIIPVKLTIGESTCTYNMQPELVKTVISGIKKKQANPFIFDTNVLYKGARTNAVDHMALAQNKGFAHSKIGAPFIIADGVLGLDGREFKINLNGENKKIRVPSFVGTLDSLLVLSHSTGHIISGYAGAIKNVAMGMASRPTKQIQHSSIKPAVAGSKCTSCGCCIGTCPVEAISWEKEKAYIDQSACIGCAECIVSCKFNAIGINWKEDPFVVAQRMVDIAKFILSKFKNKFFITFALDITKSCDCMSSKNEKIISRDIGILASSDALSIDKAAIDLINQKEDVFLKEQSHDIHQKMLKYASEKQLGSLEYDLIKM